MSGNYFNQILQEIASMTRRMDELEAENRSLHIQLAQLRAGTGVVIEICGQRFSLAGNTPAVTKETTKLPAESIGHVPETEPLLSETPTREMASIAPAHEEQTEALAEQKEATSTFLEEIMVDEFAAASQPLAVWDGPVTPQKPIDEEQKATLRRELMGSFLLE